MRSPRFQANGVTRETVRRVQRRRRIAGATAQAGANGNPLGEREVYGEPITHRLQHRRGGPDRQVLLRPSDVGAGDVDRHSTPLPSLRPDRVRQGHQAKQGFDAVIPICHPPFVIHRVIVPLPVVG